MSDFKARLWSWKTERYTKKNPVAYYCSGETEVKHQDMCVNLPDGSQLVIDTRSVIKLLKKHGRV